MISAIHMVFIFVVFVCAPALTKDAILDFFPDPDMVKARRTEQILDTAEATNRPSIFSLQELQVDIPDTFCLASGRLTGDCLISVRQYNEFVRHLRILRDGDLEAAQTRALHHAVNAHHVAEALEADTQAVYSQVLSLARKRIVNFYLQPHLERAIVSIPGKDLFAQTYESHFSEHFARKTENWFRVLYTTHLRSIDSVLAIAASAKTAGPVSEYWPLLPWSALPPQIDSSLARACSDTSKLAIARTSTGYYAVFHASDSTYSTVMKGDAYRTLIYLLLKENDVLTEKLSKHRYEKNKFRGTPTEVFVCSDGADTTEISEGFMMKNGLRTNLLDLRIQKMVNRDFYIERGDIRRVDGLYGPLWIYAPINPTSTISFSNFHAAYIHSLDEESFYGDLYDLHASEICYHVYRRIIQIESDRLARIHIERLKKLGKPIRGSDLYKFIRDRISWPEILGSLGIKPNVAYYTKGVF